MAALPARPSAGRRTRPRASRDHLDNGWTITWTTGGRCLDDQKGRGVTVSDGTQPDGRPVVNGEGLGAEAQAVYRCFSADGQVLYIGTTGHLGRRLSAHAEKVWFLEVCGMTFEWHPDELSALQAEARAIHIERPKYNIAGTGPRMRPVTRERRKQASRVQRDIVMLDEIGERRDRFVRALAAASGDGISPRRLRSISGLSNSFVHLCLADLCALGVITKVSNGVYRPVPGSDIPAAMAASRARRRGAPAQPANGSMTS